VTIARPVRKGPVSSGAEREQIESWLDYYRSTLVLKCVGLSFEQLTTAAVAPSTLTLLGILRPMTRVEQSWLQRTFAGLAPVAVYETEGDPDSDFNDLTNASLDDVEGLYWRTCERSRELCAGHGLDEVARRTRPGREVDLRWIYIHLIEEYARHCGHADLLRESIDGQTGD
jgi:hypothetical protein